MKIKQEVPEAPSNQPPPVSFASNYSTSGANLPPTSQGLPPTNPGFAPPPPSHLTDPLQSLKDVKVGIYIYIIDIQ